MRQSPTKVVFNYGQNLQSSQVYSPKIMQSGYILGQPISYANVGQLPNNLHTFSPSRSRPRATTDFITSSRIGEYEAPDPSRFVPPPNRQSYSRAQSPMKNHSPQPQLPKTISQDEYNRLLYRYNILQQRYKYLQQRCFQLQTKNRSPSPQKSRSIHSHEIIPLLQRYKTNILDQFRLLMDRARLQEKQASFNQSWIR